MEPTFDLWTTVDEIRNYRISGQLVDFGDATDEDIEQALRIAQEKITAVTGKQFNNCPYPKEFDGNGMCKLFFRGDVVGNVISVTVSNPTCCGYGGEVTKFTVYRDHLDICCNETGGCSACGGCLDKWPVGCKNICITATWGDGMPASILHALILLIQKHAALGAGCDPSANPRVTRVSWPDHEIQYQPEKTSELLYGQSTGLYEVDMILKDFIPSPFETMFVIPAEKKCCDKRKGCN